MSLALINLLALSAVPRYTSATETSPASVENKNKTAPSPTAKLNPRIPPSAVRVNGLNADKANKLAIWRTTHRCGVNALYSYLKLSDVEVSYESLLKDVPIDEDGTAISDLAKICQGYGCDAIVVKAGPKTLANLLPAIVHCEEEVGTTGHFNVVVAVNQDQVGFIDGTTGIFKFVSAIDFMKLWTGYTLTLKSHVETQSDGHFVLLQVAIFLVGGLVLLRITAGPFNGKQFLRRIGASRA